MIKASKITKTFGDLQVLKGVDLHIQKGEVVSIVGASGAGKTTLLQILGTLEKPDGGSLLIGGKDALGLSNKAMANFRNTQLGFVFQFHHLLPEFTAQENICIPAFLGGADKKTSQKRAAELLEMLGVAGRASHKPAQMSGGEQQRVAVARALMNNPSVILADEPSGNLDSANAEELHKLFFTLRDELNQTFVIVTHNDVLAGMADRKLEIKDGLI